MRLWVELALCMSARWKQDTTRTRLSRETKSQDLVSLGCLVWVIGNITFWFCTEELKAHPIIAIWSSFSLPNCSLWARIPIKLISDSCHYQDLRCEKCNAAISSWGSYFRILKENFHFHRLFIGELWTDPNLSTC